MRAQFFLLLLSAVPFLSQHPDYDFVAEDAPKAYYVLIGKRKKWVTPGQVGQPGIDMDMKTFLSGIKTDEITFLPHENYKQPNTHSKWERDFYMKECYSSRRETFAEKLKKRFGEPPKDKVETCAAPKDFNHWLTFGPTNFA